MKKRLLCVVLVAVFLLSVTGCASKKKEDSIVDSVTGGKITVGMSKEDVEKQFDDAEMSSDGQGSYYNEAHIVYDADDIVDVMFIGEESSTWSTSAGIGIGSSKEDVIEAYGEADEIDKDTYWLYYNGDIHSGFLFVQEEVFFITVYKNAQ